MTDGAEPTAIAPASRTLDVGLLSRVEGEGAVQITLDGGQVSDVTLSIFEPPRYFEALLQGRGAHETPDITARVCGICPVAYQTSSCLAVEAARQVSLSPEIAALRRLLYCGEWLQSHALHVFLLHAPDYYGHDDAVALAAAEPRIVELGLRLKRTGNLVMETVGGRAIHPVNVRVGGFYHAPDPAAVRALLAPLQRGVEDAVTAVAWASGLAIPEVERAYRFVSLRGAGHYPIESGAVVFGPDGFAASPEDFADAVREEQSPTSTALRARLGGEPYLTGPLARFAHNADLLPPLAAVAARAAGLHGPCRNPFASIIVRCVELVAACEEALRIAESYVPPDPPAAAVPIGPGRGVGVSEAPRGLLLVDYRLDENGDVERARIVPPTAQNQLAIEDDLRAVVTASLGAGDVELTRMCERAVRNHDPCISCAAHFLDLRRLKP